MKAVALYLWRAWLCPIALVIALVLILAALVEGPPLQQFVYAVF